MSRISLTCRLGLLALCMTPSALSAQSFEGVITMKANDGAGKTMLRTLRAKGAQWRMDTNIGGAAGGDASIISDGKGRIAMVNHKSRIYMYPPALQDIGGDDIPDPGAVATGRKDQVAGLSCEYYRSTKSEEKDSQWCITTALGFLGRGRVEGAAKSAAARKSFPNGFFILKKVDGHGRVAMEVIKIERKSLPDADFAPPPGYKEMRMPAMPVRQ
jgi:hypothetical protein